MANNFTWMTSAKAAATLFLLACGAGSSEPSGGAQSAGGEPALVITDGAEWQSLTESGKVSYDRACGGCHPGGEGDYGPRVKGHMATMATMTKQIREGSGRMKPIDETGLPESEMRGLMVYLATIGGVSDVKGP